MQVREIWSGGQTGVDRSALDVARSMGIATGGWVPRGRRAEDGRIPEHYAGLRETPSDDYAERTTWNVRDCDATLILHRGPLSGGSAFTHAEAVRLRKPVLAIDLGDVPAAEAVGAVLTWLRSVSGTRLNVAGPRAGTDDTIADDAGHLLTAVLAALADGNDHPGA